MNPSHSRADRARMWMPFLFAALLIVVPQRAARALDTHGSVYGASADRAVLNRSLMSAIAAAHAAIPAFSRQTKLACSVCHYQFPELTPFGRMFKLNGYTMTGLTSIVAPNDTASDPSLKLSPIPQMAAMFMVSGTHTGKELPGTQNNTAEFPQQASLFLGGQISPTVGIFSQFTYEPDAGTFGIDNTEFRYADHHEVAGHDLLLGLTLNNNPSMQDLWNTLPAWGYPFIGSGTAPGPMASTLLEGGLSQAVIGLGAYSMWDSQLYAEVSAYRSAPQGAALPADSTAVNTTSGLAPYWRVAWQHNFAADYLMLGTFGLHAELYPAGVSGLTNQFTDWGFDGQYEHPSGDGAIIARARWTHESQHRNADFYAANPASQSLDNNLASLNANVSWATSLKYGLSLGYFQTTGTADALMYQPGAVTGSANGSPDSQGLMGELTYNVWQNLRLGVQYVAYTKFNGGTTGYDGSGRSATDNNTLYTYMWVAF